jgi:hypothetical protein
VRQTYRVAVKDDIEYAENHLTFVDCRSHRLLTEIGRRRNLAQIEHAARYFGITNGQPWSQDVEAIEEPLDGS